MVEHTVGDAQRAATLESTYTSNIQPDVIKGWNDRRLSNNVNITSLVPFVQLIGVFNPTEYEKMFGSEDNPRTQKPIYFTPSPAQNIGENVLVTDYIEEYGLGESQPDDPKENKWEWIKRKLTDRFIDLFVFEGRTKGTGKQEQSILHMSPVEGIMMAEYKSQAAGATFTEAGDFEGIDSTGGIGITDLQVDYGKSNALGSRKFNIRMTVNDPAIMDQQPEYAKLSTMQGEFIILYGWSNPQIIEGFDATPPPILSPSIVPRGQGKTPKKMMIIGLDNMDTGGYWSAVKVNVTSYDFSFNEMGQLEINVGFMDMTSMMMNTTRIASIASTWKKIMGTGDYDPATTSGIPAQDFTQTMVTLPGGIQVPIADLVANEQNALSAETGSNPEGEAPLSIDDLADRGSVPFLESLEAAGEGYSIAAYNTNEGIFNQESYWNQVRKREREGFPHGGPGIRSYEKIKIRVPVNTLDEAEVLDEAAGSGLITTVPTEEVTAYRVKIVYYYLGWVLEAMRLSLNNQNRSRVREGNTTFNPQFKYLKNESSSQLRSAFQSKVSQVERAGTINERIQNAIIRLKENCMPPFKERGLGVAYKEIEAADGTIKIIPYWPRWGDDESTERPQVQHSGPCGGQVVVEGKKQATNWRSNAEFIASKIFPTPEGAAEGEPMRGHRIRIDPSADAYKDILKESERDEPPFYVFKPDWFIRDKLEDDELQIRLATGVHHTTFGEGVDRRKIEVIPAGGSPEGYDPLNPTDYKAADRGGRFFYKVELDRLETSTMRTPGTSARDRSVITISDTIRNTFVMEVDEFRKSDTEIWQLTQRKWYNTYIVYLGNYFEQVIRARIAELEREGRTVEDIYNEPVDLDFLTSKVFANYRSAKDYDPSNKRWSPCTWDQVERYFPAEAELLDSITRTEAKKDRVEEALSDERIVETNILEKITNKQNATNSLKRYIEREVGGIYETGRDATDNEMLVNFKNFKQIVRGNSRFTPSGRVYEGISEYELVSGSPQVKLEWIIWKNLKIPTDNFSPSEFDPGSGLQLQSQWKNSHLSSVEGLQTLVERAQKIIDRQIAIITQNDRLLRDDNDIYLDILENISALEAERDNLVLRLNRYNGYINENKTRARALSPYDDTSDIDDVLEIDMGRAQPMRLTTKVAQQWYSRFSTDPGRDNGQGYNWIKGVTDISNYGPRPYGLLYHRPTKLRQFSFDYGRRDEPIKGNPRTVFDMMLLGDTPRIIHLGKESSRDQDSWRMFGHSGVPNVDGRNSFGFSPGPIEINEEGNNVGGDHIAEDDYDGFLALFGLTPPETFSDAAVWPNAINALIEGYGGDADDPARSDALYYMIDDDSNIIMPAPAGSSNEGGFVQTGWHIGYAKTAVYLYPNQNNAVQIDPATGNVIRTGNKNAINSSALGDDRMNGIEEGEHWKSFGTHLRIGQDQHNIYLTLDEKRALVFPTGGRTWEVLTGNETRDYNGFRGATDKEVRTMGKEVPARGASPPGQPETAGPMEIDYDEVGPIIYQRDVPVHKNSWDGGFYNTEDPEGISSPNSAGKPVGNKTGPGKLRVSSYSNPAWPYGTGYYKRTDREYGSFQAPTGSPEQNYVYIADLIEQFPNKGFFTTVNNDNYSASTIAPDGNIIDGQDLNIGFVEFIIQNVYAPIGKNRRIATRGHGDGLPRGGIRIVKDKGTKGVDDKWKLNDTTYGHLFRPVEGDDELTEGRDISFTDFGLKNIESVADMPIRREVVDNLMNKNNVNMSLAQFIQEIIHPSAIGINTGNIHVAIRQKAAGNFEVFQATKNWRDKAAEVNEDHRRALNKHKYPVNHFLMDYKQGDSLIENIDMSSKFDPALTLTFERGAKAFAGNPNSIVKFLSYGSVAHDLRDFLADEDKVNNTKMYANVFSFIGEGPSGKAGRIEIAKNAFFDAPNNTQKKIVSTNVIAKFLMQKPERMNQLNALLQSQPGSNFATQLLSYYMRRCTLTIHGTTNLTPFNSINVSGVLPNLEGLYLITSIRESVTPQNFQTIIEAVLLRPKTIVDMEGHDYGMDYSN